jgi:dTDP-4-dehydrorhamnose 3,5-epimerase
MQFYPTPLKGAFLIDLEKLSDDRGFFSRLFCTEQFKKHGLESQVSQINDSFSLERGTLRGMHYQTPPKEETKVVRCIQGSIYDVIIDLREHSPTYKQTFAEILSQENRRMMYVPKGFAHGFLTLEPNSEILYLVSENYSQEHERGIRWNDPQFAILWPDTPKMISERDQNHPDWSKK